MHIHPQDDGGSRIASSAAGEEADTAASLTQSLDQLDDQAQTSWRLGVAVDQTAAVEVHAVQRVTSLPREPESEVVVEGGFADRTHLDHVAFISDLKDLLPTLAAMPRDAAIEKQLDRI